MYDFGQISSKNEQDYIRNLIQHHVSIILILINVYICTSTTDKDLIPLCLI